MIPEGSDALSPAPHHDIYSIEDLSQLIYALKEATRYSKPVGVKIAAVHNVAAIASGIARAGADFVYIDGFRGGTGAAPTMIRDNIGIPIEMAIAAVDDRLRQEGIRNQVTLIAAGGIRNSGDVAKAIALGADVVAIGTAALLAMGCHLCQKCNTGNCSWGIATQRPELTRRLETEETTERPRGERHREPAGQPGAPEGCRPQPGGTGRAGHQTLRPLMDVRSTKAEVGKSRNRFSSVQIKSQGICSPGFLRSFMVF
jgi:glutamate synthase domain-containing protein 2